MSQTEQVQALIAEGKTDEQIVAALSEVSKSRVAAILRVEREAGRRLKGSKPQDLGGQEKYVVRRLRQLAGEKPAPRKAIEPQAKKAPSHPTVPAAATSPRA